MATSYTTIFRSIQTDPMLKDFNEGYMSWYDICRYYDSTYDNEYYDRLNRRLNGEFVEDSEEESDKESVAECGMIIETESESENTESNGVSDNMEVDSDSDSDSDSEDDFMMSFARIHQKTPNKKTPNTPTHTLKQGVKQATIAESETGWSVVKPHVVDNGIRTIVVRNLPRDINREDLRNVFRKYGHIQDIHIPLNMDKMSPYYGTIRGFAMIEFQTSKESCSAYNGEFGTLVIRGKAITIDFAKGDRKKAEQMMMKSC